MEFKETLDTYRKLAHKEPGTYLRYLAVTLNNLGILEESPNHLEESMFERSKALPWQN